jgi:hypothetical protein
VAGDEGIELKKYPPVAPLSAVTSAKAAMLVPGANRGSSIVLAVLPSCGCPSVAIPTLSVSRVALRERNSGADGAEATAVSATTPREAVGDAVLGKGSSPR